MSAKLIVAVFVLLAVIDPALAHHPMGGTTPATFWHGLLSGFGHPILGFDHFVALIAVGCLAARELRGAPLAVGYVIATMLGVALHVAKLGVPGVEMLVALSVIALGAVLVRRDAMPTALALALFAFAGLVHGYALGESIAGAEPTPVAAYLVGLAIVQSAIALIVMFGARMAMSRAASEPALVRFVGAGVAGIGLATLVQQMSVFG